MKQAVSIALISLLCLVPFMLYAQGHYITLHGTRDPIKCELLGVVDGQIYYRTDTQTLVVIPVESVKSVKYGTKDLTKTISAESGIPLSPYALTLFPNVSDSLTTQNRALMIQQNQVDELRGIKSGVYFIGVLTLAGVIASLIAAFSSK